MSRTKLVIVKSRPFCIFWVALDLIISHNFKAFYEARNQSLLENNTADSTMHQIPASFCIDPDNDKILTCPRVGLEKGAMVYKCCPFGKQLKLPLFSGKVPKKRYARSR